MDGCLLDTPLWGAFVRPLPPRACILPVIYRREPTPGVLPAGRGAADTRRDERWKRLRSGPLPPRRKSASAPDLDAPDLDVSGLERHQYVEHLLAVARVLGIHQLAVATVGGTDLADLLECE